MKACFDARRRLAAFALALPLACLALGLMIASAFAADAAGNGVTFDLGAILSPLVQILGAVLLAVASWAVSFLPAIVRAALTEQLLKRAVEYAVATVEGAAIGKTVTIPVANEMIRVAAQYAADNGPKITQWLADSLGQKIIARLSTVVDLPAETSIVDLDHHPQTQI
jgi:hypothetical protein